MRDDTLDVLVIGAGFSGIYQLHRLRAEGFRVKAVDAASDLGGIWHWNCYTGARVDTHLPNYEYSIEEVWKDWFWTERFPSWRELRRYFEHVDRKLNLRKDIEFRKSVTAAAYQDGQNCWYVTCADGETIKARFIAACLGFAAKSYIPEISGLNTFEGEAYHTAHWPQSGVSLEGRRVAVIGTGASGVQVIQEAGKVCSQLTVFQRTPNLAIAMQQRKVGESEQLEQKPSMKEVFRLRNRSPGGFVDLSRDDRSALDVSSEEREEIFERAWKMGGFHFWAGTFPDIISNPEANKLAYDFWRKKVHARLVDPVTAETLAPTKPPHPFGAKRPSLEQWYYEIFNQDNVSLVDVRAEPIVRIHNTGVETTDGNYEADLLVLATGFDAQTGGLTQIDWTGASGSSLKDAWRDGVDTHLGIGVPGFPNLFILYGPQSPTAFWNGPVSAEVQGEWVVDCLKYLRENKWNRIEAEDEVAKNWTRYIEQIANMTLLPKADSWYMAANIPGKHRQLLSMIGTDDYVEKCRACAAEGYSGFQLS